MLVGIARFIGEYSYTAPSCGEVDERPAIIKNFHYLYFSVFLFAVTAIVAALVALITKPVDKKCVSILLYNNSLRKCIFRLYNDEARIFYLLCRTVTW